MKLYATNRHYQLAEGLHLTGLFLTVSLVGSFYNLQHAMLNGALYTVATQKYLSENQRYTLYVFDRGFNPVDEFRYTVDIA